MAGIWGVEDRRCYGLNYVSSPKIMFPPVFQNATLFGNSLYRGNQVTMRSVGWALVQCEWCPNKKRKFEPRDKCIQRE